VAKFTAANPDAKVIRLGIGDVVLPLPDPILKAFHDGVDEMGTVSSFKGYGPEQGYAFLREAIADHFKSQGANVDADEVFVSDGSKCDTGNIQEIFSLDSVIAVTDPVYPVYVDTNVMAGRTGLVDESGRYGGLVYMPATAENNFDPAIPTGHVDLIYLCSPNNPTGSVLSREALTKWVEYAKKEGAVILFDSAYEAFITEPGLVKSIYEIPGAREVAIEFRSFSKTAGFTGVRCAYTVVPKELTGKNEKGEDVSLHALWSRPGKGGFPSFWEGVDLMVAMPASWLPLAADYTRFSRSGRSAFWGTAVGYLVPNMWLYALGAILLLTRGLSDAPSVLTAVASGGAAAAVALLALGVDETKEPFANVYSAAVSLQNVFPRVPQHLLVCVVGGVATAGTFVIDFQQYASFLLLLGSFFVPLFGVLLAQWLAGCRDPFAASEVRAGQIAAWLAGFCVYQWLSPVGPHWWTSLVAVTHPAIGGSLPSFAAAFVVSLGLTLPGRALALRHRPSGA